MSEGVGCLFLTAPPRAREDRRHFHCCDVCGCVSPCRGRLPSPTHHQRQAALQLLLPVCVRRRLLRDVLPSEHWAGACCGEAWRASWAHLPGLGRCLQNARQHLRSAKLCATRGLYPKIMLITGQSWGPAGCWLYDWWAGVADTKERLVGEPRGRRALVLYINCTVIGRAAGGCRASLKLLVQLDAAEEGLGAMTGPPRECSRNSWGPSSKGFLEWAGSGRRLQLLSGCASSWLYKPCFLVVFERQ